MIFSFGIKSTFIVCSDNVFCNTCFESLNFNKQLNFIEFKELIIKKIVLLIEGCMWIRYKLSRAEERGINCTDYLTIIMFFFTFPFLTKHTWGSDPGTLVPKTEPRNMHLDYTLTTHKYWNPPRQLWNTLMPKQAGLVRTFFLLSDGPT